MKIVALLGVLFLAYSCKLESKIKGGKLQIVCTTGMLGDVVQNITKDSCDVHVIMGPGVDPHLYKVTPKDILALQSADVIVHNGLHLEGKMGDVFEKLKKEKIIINWSDGIDEKKLINNSDFPGNYDPHIWFNPLLFMDGAEYFLKRLSEADEKNTDFYTNNFNSYKKKVTDLGVWAFEEIEKLPKEDRILITSHDAFSYFGDLFGFKVRGLQGISTVSEFGIKDKVNLVNFIVENKIPAVFVESSVSDKALKSVIESCSDAGHEVIIGGLLLSDAMDEKDKLGGNYLGMIRYNIQTIINGLDGK